MISAKLHACFEERNSPFKFKVTSAKFQVVFEDKNFPLQIYKFRRVLTREIHRSNVGVINDKFQAVFDGEFLQFGQQENLQL